LEPLAFGLHRWNAGDSWSCMRIQIDTASSRIDTRKGTRQPQAANCSAVSDSAEH
jgi:hypothetical protein